MINDILDFSKIEAGKMVIESVETDIRSVVVESLEVTSYPAQQKGLETRLNWDESVPRMLVGDPLRLRQVLLNLLSNAIKFTEHGFVAVSVEREYTSEDAAEMMVRFTISDTGIGIAPEIRGKTISEFRASR